MMTPLPLPFVVLVGLLGLAVGSFLNVVIYRVPRRESVVHPGSHCPRCAAAIRTRHNIPVIGWLVLRGRCADCALPISARYPLVEAVTGLGMACVGYLLGLDALLPVGLLAVPALITLTMMTVDRRIAPNSDVSTSTPALPAPHMRSTAWPH